MELTSEHKDILFRTVLFEDSPKSRAWGVSRRELARDTGHAFEDVCTWVDELIQSGHMIRRDSKEYDHYRATRKGRFELSEKSALTKSDLSPSRNSPSDSQQVAGSETAAGVQSAIGAKMQTSVLPSESKIFISHSSKDLQVVERLRDFLQSGLDLPRNRIKCTSIPGSGPNTGDDWDSWIREELSTSDCVLFILSRNFFDSPVSCYEFGGVWVKGIKPYQLLIPPLQISELPLPNSKYELAVANNKDKLRGLCDMIRAKLGLNTNYLQFGEEFDKLFAGLVDFQTSAEAKMVEQKASLGASQASSSIKPVIEDGHRTTKTDPPVAIEKSTLEAIKYLPGASIPEAKEFLRKVGNARQLFNLLGGITQEALRASLNGDSHHSTKAERRQRNDEIRRGTLKLASPDAWELYFPPEVEDFECSVQANDSNDAVALFQKRFKEVGEFLERTEVGLFHNPYKKRYGKWPAVDDVDFWDRWISGKIWEGERVPYVGL